MCPTDVKGRDESVRLFQRLPDAPSFASATLERSHEVLEAEQRRVRLSVGRPHGQTATLNLELGKNDDALRLILDETPKVKAAYIPYQRGTE